MVVENDFSLVEVDESRGSFTRILDKVGKIDLITEPRLAGSFQLLVPLPDLQGNYVSGKEQELAEARLSGTGIVLSWKTPLINAHGPLDIGVSMTVELAGQSIEFRINVRNNSPCQVAEVWYPILGGLKGIGDRGNTKATIPCMGWAHDQDLFKDFRGMVELGIPVPEYFFPYTTSMPMPWVDLYNPALGRGLYLGCHDTVPRFGVMRFEMQPGVAHGRAGDTWPRADEVAAGVPVGVIVHWVGFPYTEPGGSFEGPPVVLRFHAGDWHDGALIYREWFESRFMAPVQQMGWIRKETAFQNAMMLLPEGNLIMRYTDIPRWAGEALRYGVKSVLISGWDKGGHDNLYPYYEPDPRVGTWEELADAIGECHRMGMRVFLFVNLQPVDCTTEWYSKELHRFRSMDPWGWSPLRGWGMGTLGARMGYTQRPMFKANPVFPEFRGIIVRQMAKLAEIGADGIHIDKLNSFGLDFNPALPMSPDRASCEGILTALREIQEACRAIRPDFDLSVESAWDRTLPLANTAWVWHPTWVNDHLPVYKFTFPRWLPAIAVCQPYDYNVVNTAVRYGYQLLVGPGHYTTSMEHEPMRALSSYIAESQRIREELKDTIFLGELLDTLQGRVEAAREVKFCVHRNLRDGGRACVLVNYGGIPQSVRVDFDPRGSRNARIHEPFKESRAARLPVTLTIPPERFAVVME